MVSCRSLQPASRNDFNSISAGRRIFINSQLVAVTAATVNSTCVHYKGSVCSSQIINLQATVTPAVGSHIDY